MATTRSTTETPAKPILKTINSPADLRRLSPAALPPLAQEIRDEILRVVSRQGGHLASSLGAVELVLGLHYVFDAPQDHLLWDMGYQAYAHKLITGRREQFETLKQFGGLSGFNNKDESPYDLFTTGHGGTVISTALGLATARDLQGESRHVVAILGDASLGEGMALEALNHVGHLKTNLIVILNDNKMSIAPSIGGIPKYLNRILTDPLYNRVHKHLGRIIKHFPRFGPRMLALSQKIEEGLKGLLVPGMLFEELGFRYIGPINGNDIDAVVTTLRNVKALDGPTLIHAVTQKGKGCKFAIDDPERFHKTEPFDLKTGQPSAQGSRLKARASSLQPPATFTEAFSRQLLALAQQDPRIVAVTAAMPEGTGLHLFKERFPKRFFDVGMAEQHGIGFCAGLATAGYKPVIALYSTFLQRAFDQVVHEVCLQRLPVILAIDRASLVGEDGPTHHGIFDIAYLRHIPNMTILAPKNETELSAMLRFAVHFGGPIAVRYPRGGSLKGPASAKFSSVCAPIARGRAELLREGRDVALIALGSMVHPAIDAAWQLEAVGISAAVVNARFARPVDGALLASLARQYAHLVTIEEGVLDGGFGSAVWESLEQQGIAVTSLHRLGLPSEFHEHGSRDRLLVRYGLTADGISAAVRAICTQAGTSTER